MTSRFIRQYNTLDMNIKLAEATPVATRSQYKMSTGTFMKDITPSIIILNCTCLLGFPVDNLIFD